MTSSELGNDGSFDSIDNELDVGLAAAFRSAERMPKETLLRDNPAVSVMATLQETLGIQARVLLRDAADDRIPIALSGHGRPQSERDALGRYQVAGEIARGGVGVVLKGRDPDLGRDVAIKVLRTEHAARPGMIARFIEEAQIAAQLQHPGILPVYELGLADAGRPFFSMKLIKGRTLAALLAERNDPTDDLQRLVTIFSQVCQAVAYAHAKGVVHRDLKPSNVMVGAFGEVQVVDWGLAKVLSTGGLADERDQDADASMIETARTGESAALSMAGSILGTPAYMSPEQARGETDRISERSDVFSLGAILCEILTGSAPYVGDRHQVLQAAQDGYLAAALGRLGGGAGDGELAAIARHCLSAKTTDRPRDAGVVAAQVDQYLAALSERARAAELAVARAEATVTHERKARRLTLTLATVVVLAVGTISAGAFFMQQERRTQESVRAGRVNEAIARASELLGVAGAAAVGKREPWMELRASEQQLRDRLAEGMVDKATFDRAQAFLQKLAVADRDRQMIERIEEVIILGATHNDKASWVWMEGQLRKSFADYGIDLDTLTPAEAAKAIRDSCQAAYLVDGLELWIATCGHLMSFGVEVKPMATLMAWTEALYEADLDPFATAIRKMMYGKDAPKVAEVRRLVESPDFGRTRPRTLAWLAAVAFRTGDHALVGEILRKAVMLHPGDFMLNFDAGYSMRYMSQKELAIRLFDRCLAIRPNSACVWRSLGQVLHETEDYAGAIDALRQSIVHQGDHAASYLDLGKSLEAAGRLDEAVAAYDRALALDGELEEARAAAERLRGQINETETKQGEE